MNINTVGKRTLGAKIEHNNKSALWAAVGPIFFALAYTILGFIRPGYSLVSEPISGLGVGDYAIFMNASFVLMGLMIFIGIIGVFRSITGLIPVARRSCFILLQLSPIGAVLCGFFTYEHFLFHTLGFFLACGMPVICYPIVGFILRCVPRYRRFAAWLIAGGPVTLILFIWFMATFDYLNTDTGTAGLIERILIVEVQAFYVALGWLAYSRKL